MRHVLFFALTALALPARGDPCDELPKPAVTLQRVESRPVDNLTYGIQALNNLGADQHRPGRQILGLTRGMATAAYTLSLPGITDPSGRWECTSPQITVRYGFTPITVYVAREFPAGSCGHGEIHAHEMRHVAAYQAHIADIEKSIGETLSRRFDTGDVWRAPAGETLVKVRKEMEERWIPYIQREIAKVSVAQAAIDSAEEYERVANACNGDIRKQLTAALGAPPPGSRRNAFRRP